MTYKVRESLLLRVVIFTGLAEMNITEIGNSPQLRQKPR